MTRRALAGSSIAMAAQASAGGPAFAHHAMDGQMPTSFAQGLLSGLAHPVIGPDHLAFIISGRYRMGPTGRMLALIRLHLLHLH